MSRALVVGVGNRFRGDDGVGLEVARRVRPDLPAVVEVVEANGDGTALMGLWAGADLAILVDASASGADPGTVRRYDATSTPIPAGLARHSTHAFGVADAVELARALEALPRRLVVYAIEGKGFEAGTALSPEVERSIDEACAGIVRELRSFDES